MPNSDDLFEAMNSEFSHEFSVTSFTCSTRATLAVPSGFRLEVFQIETTNLSIGGMDAAIGGS